MYLIITTTIVIGCVSHNNNGEEVCVQSDVLPGLISN